MATLHRREDTEKRENTTATKLLFSARSQTPDSSPPRSHPSVQREGLAASANPPGTRGTPAPTWPGFAPSPSPTANSVLSSTKPSATNNRHQINGQPERSSHSPVSPPGGLRSRPLANSDARSPPVPPSRERRPQSCTCQARTRSNSFLGAPYRAPPPARPPPRVNLPGPPSSRTRCACAAW